MKPKPWRMDVGLLIGFVVGALIWWMSYLPGAGLFQNLHLLVVPAAFAVVIVAYRNKRKKVGPYDPETIARNKEGRSD